MLPSNLDKVHNKTSPPPVTVVAAVQEEFKGDSRLPVATRTHIPTRLLFRRRNNEFVIRSDRIPEILIYM